MIDHVDEWEPDGLTEQQKRSLARFDALERLLIETLPANAYRDLALQAFHLAQMQTRLAYDTAQIAKRGTSHE